MQAELEQVMKQLEQLAAPARAEIAYRLLSSLGPEEPRDAEAFDLELARRVEEVTSGRVRGRPLEEVLAQLDALDAPEA